MLKQIILPGSSVVYSFDEWLRLTKTRFPNLEEALRENSGLPESNRQFIEEIWEDIEPLNWLECFSIEDTDKRRVYFEHLGPVTMFHQTEKKKLLDTFVFEKGARHLNQDIKGHTYELWEIDGRALKLPRVTTLHVLRFNCPSTLNEYIMFVDRSRILNAKVSFNAKEAVAWTCRSPIAVKDIAKIHRQGEVYTFVAKDLNVKPLQRPIHLTAKDYWRLIDQQT